jgi:hypothetical protein
MVNKLELSLGELVAPVPIIPESTHKCLTLSTGFRLMPTKFKPEQNIIKLAN